MTTREQACNLVASNLPPSVGDAQLAALFSRFGAVSSVRVMVDVRTGLSRGFGFVLMADQAAADAAVAATGKFNIEVGDGSKKMPGTAGTPPDVSLVPASSPPAHETGAPSRGPPLLIGYAGAGARVPGTPTSTVYVRNLPRAVTAAQVRSFMAAAVPAHVAAAALAGGGRAALVTHVALHLPKPNATAPNAAGAGGMMDEQDQSVGAAGAHGSSSGAAATNNNGGAICPHGAATDSVRAHVTFATPECAVAAAVATNGVMFTLAPAEGEVDSPLHDPQQQQQTATRILVKVVDQDHVKTAANPRRAGRGAPGAGIGATTGRSQHQQPLVSLTPLGTSGDHSSSSQNAASHLSFVTAPAATPGGASAHFPVDLQQQLQLLQQQQQQLLLSGGFNGFGASSSLMGALPLGGTWSSSSTIMPTTSKQLQQLQQPQQQQQQGSPMDTQMLRVNNLAAPFVAPMVMPPAHAAAGNLTAAPSFPAAMPYLTMLPPTSGAAQSFASPHTTAPLPLHQPQQLAQLSAATALPQQHQQQQQQQQQQHQQPPQYFSAPSTMQPQPISFATLQQLALNQQVPLAPGVGAAGGANNNTSNNNNVGLGGGATALQWQPQQALQQQQQQQQAGYTLGYAGAQLPQPTMWPPAGSLATMQPSANGGAPVVVYLSSMPPPTLGTAAPSGVVDNNGVAQYSQQRFQQGDQQQQQQQQQRPVFYVLPQPIASAAQ